MPLAEEMLRITPLDLGKEKKKQKQTKQQDRSYSVLFGATADIFYGS